MAVTGNPGDANNFTGAHGKRHIVNTCRAFAVFPGEVLDVEHHIARLGLALFHPQENPPAHHQFGQFLHGSVFRFLGGHQLAPAHDRNTIRDGHDFAQLVGDQNNGFALVAKLAQNAEQMIGFVGGEHAGWLIKDQCFGALEEGFKNFNTLLQAHRQFTHDGIGVNVQFIITGQPCQLFARFGKGRANQPSAFGAQHNIFKNGERINQHEVLVHHADAMMDCIGR